MPIHQWYEGETLECQCWNGLWNNRVPIGDSSQPSCAKQQYPPRDGCNFVCPDHSCVKEGRECVDGRYLLGDTRYMISMLETSKLAYK